MKDGRPTRRQRHNWRGITRGLEKLKAGEAGERWFHPGVVVQKDTGMLQVVATHKELFGNYVTTRINATRDEFYGDVMRIEATRVAVNAAGATVREEKFSADPGEVRKESLTASAIRRVLVEAQRVESAQAETSI